MKCICLTYSFLQLAMQLVILVQVIVLWTFMFSASSDVLIVFSFVNLVTIESHTVAVAYCI